jgi:hypothetical protein
MQNNIQFGHLAQTISEWDQYGENARLGGIYHIRNDYISHLLSRSISFSSQFLFVSSTWKPVLLCGKNEIYTPALAVLYYVAQKENTQNNTFSLRHF